MKKFLLTALSAVALAVPSAVAAEVDPGFGVEEPRPINVARRKGINPIARILFFPILPFVELQAELSPEKASCWNDRAGEVVGCKVVEQYEARPTPYQ